MGAPRISVELTDGATVEDLYRQLARTEPELAAAVRSALPIIEGEQAARGQVLEDRQQVSLLLPVSGGQSPPPPITGGTSWPSTNRPDA